MPSPGAGPAAPAAGAQARAAAWITAEVSGNAMVACYARMCAVLQEQGVAAGRLMPLRSAAASPLGATVLVTSRSASGFQRSSLPVRRSNAARLDRRRPSTFLKLPPT